MSEIFTTTLEKNSDEPSSLLESTDLVKKILDISKDGLLHTFETTKRHMSNGYNGFIRRLAHKVIELQKKNEDANNVLEAIPEWKEYCEGELLLMTTLESKPLASDPRKKQAHQADDDIEYFFKIKEFQQAKIKQAYKGQEKDQEEDKEEDGDMDFERSHNEVEYVND